MIFYIGDFTFGSAAVAVCMSRKYTKIGGLVENCQIFRLYIQVYKCVYIDMSMIGCSTVTYILYMIV